MLKRSSTREQITQILMDRIRDGTYKPGERLVELTIANELKTSQAPVREAFRYLEAMRVIESEPYKGTRVRSITDKELADSSMIRASLEELAARLACENLKNKPDTSLIQKLESEAGNFMQAAREKDFKTYSSHDIEFHRLIVEASDNQLLLSIWESVVLESRFRLTLNKIGSHKLCTFGEAHLPVIKAIKQFDGDEAGRLLKQLILKFHFIDRD